MLQISRAVLSEINVLSSIRVFSRQGNLSWLARPCGVFALSACVAWNIALPQTKPATTTTLAVTSSGGAVTTVALGSVVTMTASVNAGSTAVTTGQVNFCDATTTYCTDIHLLGTAQLTIAGTAIIKLRPGIGSHSYRAVFAGTNNDTTSGSGTMTLIVTGLYPTTTTLAQSGTAGDYTLTAAVTGPGPSMPAGTVSFVDTSNSNAVLGTSTLGAGTPGLFWLNAQTPATGQTPAFVAVGDFNRDGIPDLAEVNADSSSVSILLGTGNGTFMPAAATYATGLNPYCSTVRLD